VAVGDHKMQSELLPEKSLTPAEIVALVERLLDEAKARELGYICDQGTRSRREFVRRLKEELSSSAR
jgi:hypothetical protein